MSSRTRYFVILSLLVSVVGVGTGLVAYYVGLPAGAFTNGVLEELRYVPRDATLVAYADVREIMASDVRKRLRAATEGQENRRQDFENQTGINVETDIDHVVAYLLPGASPDAQRPGMMLARGVFAESKIEALMRDHGATVEQYRGQRLIVMSGDSSSQLATRQPDTSAAKPDRPRDLALAFMKPGLVAAGSASLVRRTVDLANGSESVLANDELMKLIRSLDSGNAWVVGRFDALKAVTPLPAVSQMPAITWFSASGRVGNDLTGVVRAETRDEASANNLRDVVRGFMALAKLQAGSQPALEPFIQSLQLGGTGNTVALSFSVPAQALDLMAPHAPKGGEERQAH